MTNFESLICEYVKYDQQLQTPTMYLGFSFENIESVDDYGNYDGFRKICINSKYKDTTAIHMIDLADIMGWMWRYVIT